MMINDSPLRKKAYQFALNVALLCKKIQEEKREYTFTKQLIKSSTSVGANVEEAQQAESRKDFIKKLSIAMKEAYESRYWINIMRDTGYATVEQIQQLPNIEEVIALIGSSIKTAKKNLTKTQNNEE